MRDKPDLGEFLAALEQSIDADEFSGVVLVAHDQIILFQHAAGMADQEEQRPNEIDARFNLAPSTVGLWQPGSV